MQGVRADVLVDYCNSMFPDIIVGLKIAIFSNLFFNFDNKRVIMLDN